ncbi:hypothetical protein PVAG01_00288 [Phlyctema vagabunda]|uniref:Uncharacterized protein n=1 Tax=Phlyctema vagabunda TaxID=108571 RepID=A0ABR4PTT9_9HELO
MNSTQSCADGSFGPAVTDCSRSFDFTLAFEESILSIVPSILLILLAPIRVVQLKAQRRRVGGRGFQIAKLSIIGLYAILQFVLLILWSVRSRQRTALSISAAVLSFLDVFLFCALSYTEHSRSLRPSALLGAYLFFSILFDAVRARTLWMMQYDIAIRGVFTASLATKVMILLLEAREKRQYLTSSDRMRSPEETSSVFNQGVFWWLNRLIREGFSKVLDMDDLYPMDEDMIAEKLGLEIRQIWTASQEGRKYRLIFALMKQFRWQMINPIIPRLFLVCFTFCQPLLLNRYLKFLQNPAEDKSTGYGLLGAYAVVYFGIAISTGFYWHRVYRWITMVRGSLVSAIYHKTTDISITALDNSAAVTLMSADIARIELGIRLTHELWANIIQVGLATWLLQRELGLACIAPLIIAALSAGGSAWIAKSAGRRQITWVDAIQRRVGITSTMLGNMKGVKMSGLTPKLSILIQNLRLAELKDMAAFRMIIIYCAVFAFIPQQISPIVTFGTFIGIESSDGRTLDTARLFTSVSLLVLLNQPLSQIFQSFPTLMSAVGCLHRIQEFLSAESRKDHRLLKPAASIAEEILRPTATRNSAARVKIPDDIELTEFKSKSSSSVPPAQSKNDLYSEVIYVRDAAFGWNKDEAPVLQDINMSIPKSSFTIVIGPVASGKTTLLKALLGETPSSKGFVHVSTLDFSFCDQTPWLLSQTVQKNILGFATFDNVWYNSVLHACALDEDVALFPLGDQTLIGSNGISLSGGQKQRLAIARAVYARREVAIFDDVFSGLDATTERHVFDRLFGPTGLLRINNTTIIVATHAVNLLPWADQIVALGKSGQIVEQGTFADLNAREGSYVHSFALRGASKRPEEVQEKNIGPYKLASHQNNALKSSVEDKARQTGDLSVYRYYFAATGRPAMIYFWVMQIVWVTVETFPSVWLKWWSSAITNNEKPSTGKYLGVYALLNVGSLFVLFLVAMHAFNTMQVRSGARLHLKTLTTVMAAPMAFFTSTDTGETINRFSQDIQLIDGELPNALFNVTTNALAAVGQAILIASATWYIAIVFPFLLMVFYLVQNYYLRTSRQLRFMDLEAKSPLYTQFLESLSGLATLRAFGWQSANHLLNNELLDASQKPVYLMYMIQRWLTIVMDFISMGLALVVVGLSLALKDSVSIGFTGVALVNIISFGETVKWVVIQWTLLETAVGAVSRTKAFESATTSENLPNEINEPQSNWPSIGHVQITDLAISYKPESGKNVVSDFNLSIRPGEKIGICGRSGSGKSSLVLALFRMIEISGGSIVIDGVDIAQLPRQEVRSRLNAIPQEPFFLYGTIRTNLDPWESQSDDKLIDALRKVELWNAIEGKGGLDTEMDVDFLSHGQRQLFCLARAILRPGRIVVLDEATSNVDRKTDNLMQRIIRQEFADHTIIVIAHRLETILDFDRIVVLHKGILKECDSPSNLLATDSSFRELYEMYENKREAGSGAALPKRDFAYGSTPVRGANIGGWLVLEPWITPSLFQQFPSGSVVDEYTLSQQPNAQSILEAHWKTWATQADFQKLADSGFNLVRIPVGYWAFEKYPGDTYIQGAAEYLEQGIQWARQAGLQVWIDLHGAPLSQNGFDNSGQRVGVPQWTSGDSVAVTKSAIRAISQKYATSEYSDVVAGIQLLNEPLMASLPGGRSATEGFYQDGFNIVRETGQTPVVFHDGFAVPNTWNGFLTGQGNAGALVDHHEYQVFSNGDVALTPEEHAAAVPGRTQGWATGQDKFLFCGEWTAAMTDCASALNGYGIGARYDGTFSKQNPDGSYQTSNYVGSCGSINFIDQWTEYNKTTTRNYIQAQIQAFETYSQGWIFWNFKTEASAEWDLFRLLDNGIWPTMS